MSLVSVHPPASNTRHTYLRVTVISHPPLGTRSETSNLKTTVFGALRPQASALNILKANKWIDDLQKTHNRAQTRKASTGTNRPAPYPVPTQQ